MLAGRSRGCRHCTLNPELAPTGTSRKASTYKTKFRYERNKSENALNFLIIVLGVSDPCLKLCYNATSVRAQMFL
jgi:hypothetical protein